jgi:hypothetical protein
MGIGTGQSTNIVPGNSIYEGETCLLILDWVNVWDEESPFGTYGKASRDKRPVC